MAKISGIHIGDFPGSFKEYGGVLPAYYLLCDGSVVSQATYPALFAKIGTSFNTGGEGVGNFRLPNSIRRVHVGSGGTGTGTLGNTVGSSGGEETHTLSVGELASHGHSYSDGGHSHPQVSGTAPGAVGADAYGSGSNNGTSVGHFNTGTGFTSITINNNGSNTPHNNLQPSLVVTKMIRY